MTPDEVRAIVREEVAAVISAQFDAWKPYFEHVGYALNVIIWQNAGGKGPKPKDPRYDYVTVDGQEKRFLKAAS